MIGGGYSGGKNLDQTLDNDDHFGNTVFLNGNRVVVGSPNDDGNNNSYNFTGAVYLYTFTDSTFAGGQLQGIIGRGYNGNKNIDQPLDNYDSFGNTLELKNNQLVVGSFLDDGFNNSKTDSGAVYLYNFTDSNFLGGSLQGIIGNGYADGNNINIPLDSYDYFGVGISIENNTLAVGASGDDGFNNNYYNRGAVYLYSFTNSSFAGGNQELIIGQGYNQTKILT